ncbi:MAG: carbohydrate kinase [Lachnospiraceae bacterium]|nr:carbohydrate kinase [Lachnospiraceae bacterium]
MSDKYDVVALGELLIDFTENGESEQGNPIMEANPGGAPCNVLAMLEKLGAKTAFIGKVGKDALGRMLNDKAAAQGIDMSGLFFDEEVHTTLAFVHKLPNGDRDFSFYRNPGADMSLTKEEVLQKADMIKGSKAFHFGTLSMTDENVEAATKEAISIAKEAGCLISFDPNYRAPLWSSEDKAKEKMRYGLSLCDVLKISDNEVEFLTGKSDIVAGVKELIEEYDIPLVFATAGPDGSYAFYKGEQYSQQAFLNKNTVETTGAGDTFMATALYYAVTNGIDGLNGGILKEALRYASLAASLITTRKGALAVMPDRAEIDAYAATF